MLLGGGVGGGVGGGNDGGNGGGGGGGGGTHCYVIVSLQATPVPRPLPVVAVHCCT